MHGTTRNARNDTKCTERHEMHGTTRNARNDTPPDEIESEGICRSVNTTYASPFAAALIFSCNSGVIFDVPLHFGYFLQLRK